MATKKVLACSHSRSLQLLCPVGGSQARLDARTEFKNFAALAKWGGEAGRAMHCKKNLMGCQEDLQILQISPILANTRQY